MSAWLKHVKSTMKENPDKTLKEVLQSAKKTYKKGGTKTAKKLVLRKGGGEKESQGKHRGGSTIYDEEKESQGKRRGGGEKESQGKRRMYRGGDVMGTSDDMMGTSDDLMLEQPELESVKESQPKDGDMEGGKRHKRRQTKTRKHHKKGGKKHAKRQTKRHTKSRKHHKKGGSCGCAM